MKRATASVHSRFTRIIPELKDLSYAERLDKLNLCAHLIEVYKVVYINGLPAIPFEYLFDVDNSGRTRGHSLKLLKKRCRLDSRVYFFSERVVNLCNNLDDQSATASSLNSYR